MKQVEAMQEVTIYDIARMAEVSPTTVSRVINNSPKVSKATRAKVTKLLDQYNFAPNEAARGLVMQSTKMIGILITDIRTTQHTDGIYYIQRDLEEKGYTCLIYSTGREEANWAKYLQVLNQRKVEAVVLMGSIYQTEKMQRLIATNMKSIPFIFCNGVLKGDNIFSILADELGGVLDCVELLHRKGRLHPAYIVNQPTPSNMQKQEGYLKGMAQYYPHEEPIVREVGTEVRTQYENIFEFVKSHPEIDSIIFSEDMLALVGMRVLADLNRRIPKDVAIIGINNSNHAKLSIPAMTSLDNAIYDMGTTAARNVVSLLSGERVSRRMMIGTELVERQTT